MSNILIRDVPKSVHSTLQQRAERQGQSLQQFLPAELRRLAEREPVHAVLVRIRSRSGGQIGLAQAVADLDDARGS
jgi:plasmid stability protein